MVDLPESEEAHYFILKCTGFTPKEYVNVFAVEPVG